jgi:cytochrome c oxidase cbb3-type subunit III
MVRAWPQTGDHRLSEVDVTAGQRYKRLGWLILAAILVVSMTFGAVLWKQNRALRARFLTVTADSIPRDTELVNFALPRGASAYARHCAACHGPHLRGDPSLAIPNLADGEWLYGTGRVSEIERVILYGIRSGNSRGWDLAHMPAFGTARPYDLYAVAPLSPGEIDDVTTYVLSFQHPQADTAAVQRGRKIFYDSSKGVCNDCHGSDAKGDSAIGAPDLTDRVWLRGDGSRQSVAETIAHGLAGHCPAWITELPPETIRAIAMYVHSVSESKRE